MLTDAIVLHEDQNRNAGNILMMAVDKGHLHKGVSACLASIMHLHQLEQHNSSCMQIA